MPLVQDQSFDLLIGSPARFHFATDASFFGRRGYPVCNATATEMMTMSTDLVSTQMWDFVWFTHEVNVIKYKWKDLHRQQPTFIIDKANKRMYCVPLGVISQCVSFSTINIT